ncbi:MAG: hypothetical protein LUD81_03240 [Clostridiales bacterium]|nr:hypothetical protein [Clostridiales bacterium]
MNESILTSVKKFLGIEESYEYFDQDIIIHINSVLSVLAQLGVGTEGFGISDKSAVWSDFTDNEKIQMIKSYVYLKVRLLFDPPTVSSHVDAINNMISEYEWRLNVAVDPGEEES